MRMTFSQHESIDPNWGYELMDHTVCRIHQPAESASDEFHILRGKLTIPRSASLIKRPRINSLLKKSVDQFPATLISGRSGTGKTCLAAGFAAARKNVSWYSVESTDVGWPVFSRHFAASLPSTVYENPKNAVFDSSEKVPSQTDIARFLVNRFSHAYIGPPVGTSLIVLDDIHHLFDAPWFGEFFNLLLYSLPPETHLLLLCRSKPPGPLWRLRSKQMLNVIDEKFIAFNVAETETLFKSLGISPTKAKKAHRDCFGRISKLLQFAGD